MAEVSLPLPAELMYPTLRAVVALSGSAEYAEIDEKVIEMASQVIPHAMAHAVELRVPLPVEGGWARSWGELK